MMTTVRRCGIVWMCAMGAALAACHTIDSVVQRGGRAISLGEFAGDADLRRPELPEPTATDAAATDAPAAGAQASAAETTSAATPGTRITSGSAADGPVVVDSLIGQVNGRPIYASEFFEPIHDELRAMRNQQSQVAFPTFMDNRVTLRLLEIVDNELILADAETNLTEEQQQGLLAFLRYREEVEIARGGGYEQGIQRKLREEEEGLTLDEYLTIRRNQALLAQFLSEKVEPRVIVSWRDIEREYQRRYAEFHPPAVVRLAQIRLATDDESEQIENVKRRLAAGEPFAQVAESLGIPDGGFWREITTPTGEIADIELGEEVKKHLVGLSPGETSEPFRIGSSTWWLHVVAIERPRELDIYEPEVQRGLRDLLENMRRQREIERYASMLRERWVADDLEQMRQRLLQIARARYLR